MRIELFQMFEGSAQGHPHFPLTVRYTSEAASRFRRLHPQVKSAIRDCIRTLLESPFAAHALHFELAGHWSYRVGRYRTIYKVDDEDSFLDIVFVGPQRNTYEELRSLLLEKSGPH